MIAAEAADPLAVSLRGKATAAADDARSDTSLEFMEK